MAVERMLCFNSRNLPPGKQFMYKPYCPTTPCVLCTALTECIYNVGVASKSEQACNDFSLKRESQSTEVVHNIVLVVVDEFSLNTVSCPGAWKLCLNEGYYFSIAFNILLPRPVVPQMFTVVTHSYRYMCEITH